MNKELLEQLKEEERLNNILPWLRREYNSLVDVIEKGNKDLQSIKQQRDNYILEIQKQRYILDKDKQEFEIYKEKEQKKLDTETKQEQIKLFNLIEEENLSNIELVKKLNQYDKDKIEFEEYKKQENTKIILERKDIITKQSENKNKEQVLLSLKEELDTQRNEVAQSIIECKKSMKLAQEIEQISNKSKLDIKKETENMNLVKKELDIQEDKLIKLSQDISKREKIVKQKEDELDKREQDIKNKEINIWERDYNMKIKEADLINEEKRLILISKQLKNG